MKICRYQDTPDGPVKIGVVRGNRVHDVSSVADMLPDVRWPYPPGDLFITNLERLRPVMEDLAEKTPDVPVASVLLRNPVANPGKFLCGAGNHKIVLEMGGHPRRLGLLFKMTNAAAGPADGVTLRWPERTTFHEMEIAIVIGKQGTEIPASEALDYVAGYCIGLDMTMQGSEFPSFGKSFDTYGVMGPWLTTRDEIADPDNLSYCLKVNGEDRQVDSTANLVLGIAGLVEHAASVMTLYPGDVIFSGTLPRSTGPVAPGDVMHAAMEGLGEMTVQVRGGPGRKTPLDGMEPAETATG
ncbi:fumarylacetoacetate hydrolase family protein [Novosphingobium album (ex Hu et al. 2023)]|uniref:Fumarylacetoacetate hydrolase family protein n=1 Tax=Novosphingobium album (ex Hu et al. 2023) TaxID=2930093 RepID=A0ABT0B329_9SPHN|nr:fumarylacetoacetate hydrolase family protein [Novosphingobium album (ex Hu et al. 2023)]MCJ2179304.1 fumarylacetoacetate hydrolase family protein [Novosphingobium album (ex Hu et al. 2023)]